MTEKISFEVVKSITIKLEDLQCQCLKIMDLTKKPEAISKHEAEEIQLLFSALKTKLKFEAKSLWNRRKSLDLAEQKYLVPTVLRAWTMLRWSRSFHPEAVSWRSAVVDCEYELARAIKHLNLIRPP